MKLFKYIIIASLTLFLIACGNDESEVEDDTNKHNNIDTIEGIIAEKLVIDGSQFLLVIPNIEESDLQGKNEDEMIMIASENNGTYFWVSQEVFDEFEVMQKVVVKYDLDGPVDESDPPIRDLIEIQPFDY